MPTDISQSRFTSKGELLSYQYTQNKDIDKQNAIRQGSASNVLNSWTNGKNTTSRSMVCTNDVFRRISVNTPYSVSELERNRLAVSISILVRFWHNTAYLHESLCPFRFVTISVSGYFDLCLFGLAPSSF